MNWINFFFYVIVLNSLTGTVAYLLCKLLALVAKKYNAIRIIYPLYRLVLLFYIVPLGSLYTKCKSYFWYGANTIGDGFLGNQVIYKVMQCCLLIWFSGMLFVGLHYLKNGKSTDGSAGKTFLFTETNIVQFCKSCIQEKIGKR